MMFILFFAFILLIVKAFSGLDPIKLNYTDWKFLPATFPVLLCSFGFHNTIPLAAKTLKGDVKRINLALFLGSLIPLILNMIILVAVAGVLHPSIGGKTSLISAFKSSLPATVPLSIKFNSSFFTIFGLIFSILAIFTSYLAVGAGLLGFTKDCLSKWKNNFKYSEHLITFGIPLIITIFAQNIFLKAINFAAGIGAVIIFGIMPCILATKKYKSKLKIISIIFLLLFICMFLIELGQQLNLFKILPKFF